jgi:hypothetical protein
MESGLLLPPKARPISFSSLDRIRGRRYDASRKSGLVVVKCEGRASLEERTL